MDWPPGGVFYMIIKSTCLEKDLADRWIDLIGLPA